MKLGGRHIVLPQRTPIANLHLTLLQKVGVERGKFGDTIGRNCPAWPGRKLLRSEVSSRHPTLFGAG